jgi:sugar/nucleoside kinase (ribokinase family)
VDGKELALKVVTLGDLVADIVVAIPRLPVRAQEHQIAHEIAIEAGGTGNFLIMAARLGMQARALGTVGDDFYGRRVLELLAGEDVDVDSVVVVPETRTITCVTLVDDQAQHVFLGLLDGGRGRDQSLSFDPAWRAIIQPADAVFTTGYALDPTSGFPPAILLAGLETARGRNIPVFFDLSPRAFHVSQEWISTAISLATVFLATEAELLDWVQTDKLDEAIQAILGVGPAMVVIKQGEQGCLLATARRQVRVEAFRVAVRDTAGAGDAFDAACVYGYLKGFSLEQIGTLANAVGAASVAKLGTGTRLPRLPEVEALLRTRPINVPL